MSSRFAHAVWVGRSLDETRDLENMREWWVTRHDLPDYYVDTPESRKYAKNHKREAIRNLAQWIRFTRACKALSEGEFRHYDDMRFEYAGHRWADDGGVVHFQES